MRDVGRCVRGLGISGTFVPNLIRGPEKRSSLWRDAVKTSPVFGNIALVLGVLVDDSVLLA